MTIERVRPDDVTRSRRLPPLEAWKKPDKWIDISSGLARRDAPRLVFPVDDRGFVRPDQIVESVTDTLFWNDYDWPFDPSDMETRPDEHHFYYERKKYLVDANQGDEIPHQFRELPTSIGRMPRQLHNAIHDFSLPPEKPDNEAMREYVGSYQLAHEAFRKMFKRAKRVLHHIDMPYDMAPFDINEKRMDPIDEAFMQSFFSEHFKTYSVSIELFRVASQNIDLEQYILEAHRQRMIEFAERIGDFASQKYFNFTPLLQAA